MRYFAAIIIFFFPALLLAQSVPYDSACSEKAIRSLEDISASIISDSFSPMTHYSKENITCSAVPAYFNVKKVMKDPDVKGDGLKGEALGAGGAYAITDDLMAYLVFAGMRMKGDVSYAAYGESFPVVKSSVDYSYYTLLGGVGYDLLDNDIFSIPVYFGAQVQRYSADLVSDPVSWYDSQLTMQNYTVRGKSSGSGFMYGISGGIAVSAKLWKRIKVTPYFLYIYNFNGGEMDAELALDSANPFLSGKKNFSFDVDPLSAGMTGLNIGYSGDSPFSFSVALGSMISSLAGYGSKASANGVDMKSVVLIFSYNI